MARTDEYVGRMALIERDLLISDLVQLEKKALFPIENLTNKPIVVQRTFEDEKGLIGSIVVNRTAELVAIFNNDRSKRDLVMTMNQISGILYRELAPQGYKDIHTFIADPKFADILVKHFEFTNCKGRALVRLY